MDSPSQISRTTWFLRECLPLKIIDLSLLKIRVRSGILMGLSNVYEFLEAPWLDYCSLHRGLILQCIRNKSGGILGIREVKCTTFFGTALRYLWENLYALGIILLRPRGRFLMLKIPPLFWEMYECSLCSCAYPSKTSRGVNPPNIQLPSDVIIASK